MSKPVLPSTEFSLELMKGGVDAAVTAAGASRGGGNYRVPPDKIRKIEGFNVRIKDAAYWERVKLIKNSIIANGYDTAKPLKVFVSKEDDGSYFDLIDGEHRLDAVNMAIEAGVVIDFVPVSIAPAGTSMEDLNFSLINSNSGAPLSPYETAIVFKRLIGRGVDEHEIARRSGYSKKYVDDLLGLMAAPKAVRDMVIKGQITVTLALAELKNGDAKAIVERLKGALDTAQAAGKTRATAKHIRKAGTPKKTKPAPEATLPVEVVSEVVLVTRDVALSWVDQAGFAIGGEGDDRFLALITAVAREINLRGGLVHIDTGEPL